jgi:hypothetical protein
MSARAFADDSLEASVATTFDVLSFEMELAAARSIMLDAAIGDMMKVIPEDEQDRFVETMHTIDLLSQQLTSLSAFARSMSGNVAEDASARVGPALGDITLSALADRMSAALGGASKGIFDHDQAGDLDLF